MAQSNGRGSERQSKRQLSFKKLETHSSGVLQRTRLRVFKHWNYDPAY